MSINRPAPFMPAGRNNAATQHRRPERYNSESGNIMVYILLAVMLLAALTFAIAQGGRSNIQAVDSERARLVATEIVNYGDTIEKAVTQLRLRGTATADLSFAHPDLPDSDYGSYTTGTADNKRFDEIFNPAGGAVIYQQASAEALTGASADYLFLGSNAVEGIGTTCMTDDCSELLMAVPGLHEDVCRALNDLIGLGSGAPPVDSAFDESGTYNGSFSYSKTLGDEASSAALSRQSEGCFYDNGDSRYVYYKVLLAR